MERIGTEQSNADPGSTGRLHFPERWRHGVMYVPISTTNCALAACVDLHTRPLPLFQVLPERVQPWRLRPGGSCLGIAVRLGDLYHR
jgi:hypothetical protein